MASRADLEAGRAFVRLYFKNDMSRRLARALKSAGQQLKSFGRGAMVVGAAILGPLAASVKAASAMEETMNKFNVVFGANATTVKAWSDDFANEIGRSKQQIAEFISSSQDLLVPLGFEAGAATEMSKQITALVIDLASFNNMADVDVQRDLQAALTGSGEVMKKYGVIVSEAAVKQELFNQGLDPQAATNQQKVQARLNIILQGTTAAQGDAARSAGSFANQMKALKGSVMDAAVVVGQSLLPIITPLVADLVKAAKAAGKWIKENRDLVVVVAKVAVVLGIGGAALWAFGTAATAAATATGALSVAMAFLAANPLVLVAAALVAAGVAAFYFSTRAAKLSTAMSDVRQKADEQRTADRALMQELQNLADKQSLTNDEMDRAETIVGKLTKEYGDLGIEINRTTGEINGMAAAQASLVDVMKQRLLIELEREEREAAANRARVINERRGVSGIIREGLGPTLGGRAGRLARIQAATERLAAIRQRIRAVKGDETGALTGDAAPPAGIETDDDDLFTPDTTMSAQAQAFNERMLDRIADMRIARIEDEHERAVAGINKRYNLEMQRAKELGASQMIVAKARMDAMADEEKIHKKRMQQERTKQVLSFIGSWGKKLGFFPDKNALAPDARDIPRIALTATYSAEAARISGFQPGGPQKKMADGIVEVAKNTKELKIVMQQFVAGWKVA